MFTDLFLSYDDVKTILDLKIISNRFWRVVLGYPAILVAWVARNFLEFIPLVQLTFMIVFTAVLAYHSAWWLIG
jgi:hypothetical protein